MEAKPILFREPMVRAIIEGRKTQTRRVVKLPDDILPERTFVDPGNVPIFGPGPYVKAFHMVEGEELMYPRIRCPYGYPGDRLWVRETWCQDDSGNICFRADDWTDCPSETGKWRPSIYLPREFSRLTLEIAEVRVERVQDISPDDCVAESVTVYGSTDSGDLRQAYAELWDSINGKTYPWASNPWVWAIHFSRLP
jgi:hypothetical protein